MTSGYKSSLTSQKWSARYVMNNYMNE